ncbi:MAG TPA: PLP-dependent aspartate aminotransferase family protein, partial [Myxococcales bacterium]|nr:PLP-dependent aspartate aminotransferase family protein [Myxococcales bacterium]
MSNTRAGPGTVAVHAGTDEAGNAPLTVPIIQSTTFRFESAAQVQAYNRGESGLFMYTRDENPTLRAAEEALARLSGAESAVVFASGMGAMTTALLSLLSAGDEVIAATALYGGTYKLLRDVLSRFGVRLRPVEPDRIAAEIAARPAKVCVFESPTNPALRIVDLAAVVSACKGSGTISLMDSTFAPPPLQRPVELGVDVVMHSATKYLNGHSDHLGGVLLGSRARIEPLRSMAQRLGAVLDPQVAYDLLRGLKTLPLRMERHSATALRIARWLAEQPRVERVFYPGLPSHPDYELARRQMSAFGGMVTFSVGTKERAFRFWDRLRLVARAASLGGVET